MRADFTAATWRKSSRSNAEQECVEVAQAPAIIGTEDTAATWRKSRRSNAEQACVEVTQTSAAIGVRDSKNPEGGHLTLAPTVFAGLLARVKSGDLDL
ncbi:DUF397 domain-containing protein [Actinomadura litoris]|uniref:DUF397 domain-containing protein n=1 Tax=Actinomadura litoris TaxID=2678616 RepID=A0A7K1KYS2_9ACTN|nr:DUF397 domain-containing protein [Actinomadura litoris]MUN37086.1 DUF397 domain-containing protein [Actinomadura litoris]